MTPGQHQRAEQTKAPLRRVTASRRYGVEAAYRLKLSCGHERTFDGSRPPADARCEECRPDRAPDAEEIAYPPGVPDLPDLRRRAQN